MPFIRLAILSVATVTWATASLADRASVLVFDASGSMWNRVEGDTSRIEVARDVMAEYFASRDGALPLSVIAYGHNRRGDCSDLEVIAAMGQTAPDTLEQRLRALMPRGMTPLTDSLILARGQIPDIAEAADIILVTDGLETCGGDPCAFAASLAAEGIDIRAHVVGFGLTEPEVAALSCITDQTGGMLFQTNSGAELADALRQVSVGAPPAGPVPEAAPVPEASFDIGDKAEAGYTYTIRWKGAARNTDYLGFVPQGESHAVSSGSFRTIGGTGATPNNPLKRTAPAEPGIYDLIIRASGGVVIARQAVEVVPPAMGFDPIGSVEPGSRVRFVFRGPEQIGERIVIADPDQPVGEHQRHGWDNAMASNGGRTLTVPETPGEYEVRYLNSGATKIMFSRRFGVGIPFQDADLTTAADLAAKAVAATQGDPSQDDIATVTATFRLPPDVPDSPVSWDAVPLDPDMSPEAWAPSETGSVITGTFEPGNWRVTARAPGETLLSADVAIFPGQANDFTLGVVATNDEDDAGLMLNGDWRILAIPPRDAPAGSPTGPIDMARMTLILNADAMAYDGFVVPSEMMAPQVAETRVDLDGVREEDGYIYLDFALPAVSPEPFVVSLSSQGEGFSGTMVSGLNSLPVVLWPIDAALPAMDMLQTLLYGPSPEDHGALIDGTVPVQSMGCPKPVCTVSHPEYGLTAQVPRGWLMHQVEQGRDGVSAQFTEGKSVVMLLGGMDWAAENGACFDSAAGPVCHWKTDPPEAAVAARFIAANLQVREVEKASTAPENADSDGIVITLTGTTQFGSGCFIKAELSNPTGEDFTLRAPVTASASGADIRSVPGPETALRFEIMVTGQYGSTISDMMLMAPCDAITLDIGTASCTYRVGDGIVDRDCPVPVTFLPFGAPSVSTETTPAGSSPDARLRPLDLGDVTEKEFLDRLLPPARSE